MPLFFSPLSSSIALGSQESMYDQLRRLNLNNLPLSLQDVRGIHRIPKSILRPAIIQQRLPPNTLIAEKVKKKTNVLNDNGLGKMSSIGPTGIWKEQYMQSCVDLRSFQRYEMFPNESSARGSVHLGSENMHALLNILSKSLTSNLFNFWSNFT